jgi:hypothetical protein
MNFLFGWLREAVANVAAFFAGFFTGKLHEKKEQAEERADHAEANADRWANKPRTYDEFAERMRRRAKARKRP